MWPDLKLKYGHGENYPLPFAFIRTALFSSMRYRGRERPEYTQKAEIACYGKGTITQVAGEQLDGNDLDVIAGCIRLVYDAGLLEQAVVSVQFNEKEFLCKMGWQTGGAQRNALAQSLHRMQTAVFEFGAANVKDWDGGSQQASLILGFTKGLDKNRTSYTVTLNGCIASLMRAGWSLVRRSQRNVLRDMPLAQSLHAFYSTHSAPIPLPESKLRPLMLRGRMRDDKWLGSLRAATAALQAATDWQCMLSDAGVVTVRKPKQPAEAVQKTTGRPEAATVQYEYDDI
jgi:hypothetical protein